MKTKEPIILPEGDEEFVRRLESAQYKWYGDPELWRRGQDKDDGQAPAGITRADHRRVVQLARHLVNVRKAFKDVE